MMYRQGDVLLRRVESLPSSVKAVARDQGRVVLAYGEVTGHAHALRDGRVAMFRDTGTGNGTFITVTGDTSAPLQHEEHSTIDVPPGHYEVIGQSEYTPEEIRRVAD